MLSIKYTKLALADLNNAYEYICTENPLAAHSIIEKIETTLSHIRLQPYIGHAGRVPNTYEFLVLGTPFIIIYMIEDNCLIVVAILHTARKYP